MPAFRSALRTLDISVRFLVGSALGRPGVALADELLDGWSKDIFRYGSASVRVEGLRHIHAGRPYVVMSNHVSLTDIPALIATFPGSLRMVAKQELMHVPVWGRAMLGSGFIPIDRKNRARAIEQLEIAKERMNNGIAVWISPEGTRSRTGELGSFKKGGFHLAAQLGAEIVPCFIRGTERALPVDTFVSNYNVPVVVRYGAAIAAKGKSIEDLMVEVRERISALRASSPESVSAE